jgi:hypothetical protein
LAPGANVTKLFTTVIYHHSMFIPSFCVIKLYYLGNYSGMALNYQGILTLEKVRLKLPLQFTKVLFYNIVPRLFKQFIGGIITLSGGFIYDL